MFIFAVCPIVFLYALNIRETPLSDTVLPIILALILCLMFFLIAKLLLKNNQKAAYLTSVFLILFFSYGHLFDFLRTTPLDKIIHGKQLVIFSIYIIIFSVAAFKTWRSRKSFLRLTKILNIISIILISVPLFMITSFFIRNFFVKLPVTEISSGEKFDKSKVRSNEKLPDIYYIILDRYGREDTLKRAFNYDNTDFLSVLAGKGFYITPKSRANYADTAHSLVSSLNMTHLNYLSVLGKQNYTDWNLLFKKVANNEVLQTLKSLDYKTIQFGSWWIQSKVNSYVDMNINIDTTPGFHYLILSKTMLHPIRVKLGMMHYFLEEQWEREQMKFKKLKEVAYQKGPKFVFAHFLITHPPYTFRADGSYLDENSQKDMSNKEKYLYCLKYTNKEILAFVDHLLQNKDNYNPIIIIQADEGPYSDRIGEDNKNFDWSSATDDEIAEKLGILNAYYFPGGGDKLLYPSISPVNTFRIVFNYYFGQKYQMLSDDSFLSNMNQPYVFVPVKK
ncbi:LTA synthase family protein [Candidatus Microgenomates bacterium]|nr:LTA synthase family protein [Candidatus Microgenomates bacterium]